MASGGVPLQLVTRLTRVLCCLLPQTPGSALIEEVLQELRGGLGHASKTGRRCWPGQ